MHPASPEHRQQMLNMAVNAEVAQGARIDELTQTSARLTKKPPVNHVLHAFLTVCTCALWLAVWLVVAEMARPQSLRLDVDEFGIVHRTYDWPRNTPMRLRIPGTRQPLALNLEINEYGACSEVLVVHGLYSTPAIAC